MQKFFYSPIFIILSLLFLDFFSKLFILYSSGFPIAFYGHYSSLFPTYFKISHILPFFDIILVWNDGVSFSMLSSQSQFNRWFLVIFTSIIVIYIFFLLLKEKNLINKIAFSFIIAGALGNLFDRIRYGAVIDFLDFYIGTYHWPAFNFADIFICIGVFLLIFFNLSFMKKNHIT